LIPVIMAAPSVPAVRDRVALHVLQAGAIAVVLASLPYKAFDLDRYFVPKELVLHVCAAAAALLCISNRKRLGVTVVDALLGAFLVSGLLSTMLATNGWAAERALAISTSSVLLFWVASSLRQSALSRPLLAALAAGVVLAAATSLAQAYGVQTEYFSLNRAPGGTFGNRNFIAHLAAIGMPVVVLVALTARRGLGSLFGGIGMAVIGAALVMSRSRGAWLAVVVLAVPAGLLLYATRRRWSEPRTKRRSIVLAAATVAGALAAVILPNRLEWKSDSPYLDSAAGLVNYKEGSGKGRLVQYGNSLRMTAAHPVFGVGPGNWPVVYPKFASRNDPSMSQDDGLTSNPWPSSDWVAYLSERGGVGLGFVLLAMFGLLGRALRDLRAGTERDAERVLTAIALIGTLIATAVVGAFDAVLLIGAPAFFVWTLAGALAPPRPGNVELEWGVHQLGPALVFGIGVISIGRSATQLAAMTVYSASTRPAVLAQAVQLDPGNYRIRVRLAQAYLARGDCARARVQAHAAHDLFPSAGEPKRDISACGGK
jgi:O-antigen ligase